ncbi:ScyD/ScyE family protein [Actinoplanes couchii]|uniref:NHL repeat containing protein n=1 Tax=Actinoplanes couchii TaxID=403638 RepID=A0ABQ3X1V3_9ACTN|nr:ScyD/ScyE family protein [Actinoplanes couchii]GID52383.1 hypothetical protein Aco03nite_007870 [Actinoplanes couchii]
MWVAGWSLFCVSLTAVTVPVVPEPGDFRYGGPGARVVARGLDNPRGMAFGPRGELYVAEAGRGGDTACRPGPAGDRICDGPSGAVSVVDFGHQWRVVSRLPSTAPVTGDHASGVADVAVGADGDLIHVGDSDRDLVAVLAVDRGRLVVDATGSALLLITARGRVRTVATFPGRAVSSVAEGPDGAWYVGERARIWRVVPGHEPQVWAGGFTRIVDLAWSPEGRLYVLESGALLRVDGGGARTVVLSAGLTDPGGLAIRGGEAYVSNCGSCRGIGTILRVGLPER